MNLHEEVYTSAAELLDRSSGNLGIVARTKQFPNELEPELQSYRGYSVLPEFRDEAADRHPPRFVLGPCRSGQDKYGVTRVGFAGADHTGRTTPLAHHIVVSRREMQSDGLAPWLVAWSLKEKFHSRWQQPPTWIDPPRSINAALRPNGTLHSFEWALSIESHKKALTTAVDMLMHFPNRRQPVVFCLPTEKAGLALDLIIDVLQLLPNSLQHQVVATTHVVDVSDYVRDAWLMVTYPNTPFYERCRVRVDAEKPIVIDLCSSEERSGDSIGDVGKTIAALWKTEDTTSVLAAMKIWDQVGISPKSAAVFPKVIDLRMRIQKISGADQLPDLAGRFATAYAAVDHRDVLKEWSLSLISDRVKRFPISDRAQALATIRMDSRWPDETRAVAWQEIAAQPDEAIPCLIDMVKADTPQEMELKAALRTLLASMPEYFSSSLERAISSSALRDTRVTTLLLNCGSLSIEEFVTAGCRLIAIGRDSDDVLLAGLIRTLATRPLHAQEAATLCHGTIKHDVAPWRFWQLVAFPTLLKHWDSFAPQDVVGVALLISQVGMRTGTLLQDIQLILGRKRSKLPSEIINSWLQQTAGTLFDADLRRLLEQAGLLAAVIPVAQLANAGPLIHAHDWRQSRSIGSSVGPIRAPLCLSLLALALSVLQYAAWRAPDTVANIWKPGSRAAFTFVMLLAVPVLYLIWAGFIRWWARNKSSFSMIRVIRWVWTVVLCSVVIFSAWPTLQFLKSSISPQ